MVDRKNNRMKMATRITIVIFLPRFICFNKFSCIILLLNGSVVVRKQHLVFGMIEIDVKIGKKM